ncbi:DUF6 domain protein [Pelomyxa schiedti]|nr:DUF6 domain protein [Pelomyxa schiedti]
MSAVAPEVTVNGLQVLSDTHLEHRTNMEEFCIGGCGRYLALLGDICVVYGKAIQFYKEFLLRVSKQFDKVFLLYGNHEFYGSETGECKSLIAEIVGSLPNIVILENNSFDIPETNWRILGCTLWSHVPPQSARCVTATLNDYRLIRALSPAGEAKEITVDDTNGWHDQSRVWLETQIKKAKADCKRVIVLTHHAPIPNAHPKYIGYPANSAFETDLRHMMNSPVKAWFYGHTHYSREDTINGVLCKSNQVGYPRENGRCELDYVFPLDWCPSESSLNTLFIVLWILCLLCLLSCITQQF